MESRRTDLLFYCADPVTNRKCLFQDSLSFAKFGKVLYIVYGELKELPQLSQDLSMINKHYMKMISFLYVNSLDALIQSLTTLPDWQNLPSAIILDNLSEFCPKDKMQNACGVVAFLIDTMRSCSRVFNVLNKLCISIDESVGEEYVNTLRDLYGVNLKE